MTEVVPFKGVVYNTEKIKGDDVVSPPYDIISPEVKDELYRKSPYNFVRVDFGKTYDTDSDQENRYTRARRFLTEWLREGILIQAERPLFYVCKVSYTIENRQEVMRGIFGRVYITDLCKGVYPHEATHSKPKADRLSLIKHCNANLSPIFSIYNRRDCNLGGIFERTCSEKPYMEARDLNGARHRMWLLDDPDDISFIQEKLRGRPIYIADGHHRYETALDYRNEMMRKNPSHTGREPYNYVLMYLVNIADGGLTVLPTHRLVKRLSHKSGSVKDSIIKPLERYFILRRIEDVAGIVREIEGNQHTIGLALNGDKSGYVLRYTGDNLSGTPGVLRDLDVTVLHELILKRIFRVEEVAFEMDTETTLRRVRTGEFQAAFFLRPTSVSEVEKVSLTCLRMPPKSTYFYPKILTGMVINRLDIE
ncbi:hypothetical protein BMS3Bbin06_00209 [bacterium BMS3Bbin06]|nr:hypothetical protein BMS3Abin08_01287 [bacterium BMS3Abin08]GBE33696.1 hypothetical protein BMS3Bbin06_00209 [bacterium BMS3Bbin06]HDO36852.1 DUF1015 domain-containing protein [Nitrospirota bacterium]HDY70387.1 DUF1015 domain-containing protein [Nitrospirota bacterium]